MQRLRLWTPARWAAAAPDVWPDVGPGLTRGDLAYRLAQAWADQAAELEGGPRRVLPRLDSDLGLADQLAVTVDDLLRAGLDGPAARTATAHLLVHRLDLLGEQVPTSRADSLGIDVLFTGRKVCRCDKIDRTALEE